MADVAAQADGPEKVFRLIYRSQSFIPAEGSKVALGQLFSQARSNNKDLHITGALLLAGGWFVQTLEGDESAVRDLYATIGKDDRHGQVTVLETRNRVNRLFSRWSMARVGEEGEADIPLIAGAGGIKTAADRRMTPEQESVLSYMRESASAARTTY